MPRSGVVMAMGRVFQGAVHMTEQLGFDCVPAYVVVIAVLMIAFLVVGVG